MSSPKSRRRLGRHARGVFGGLLLIFVLALAVMPTLRLGSDPSAQSLRDRLKPPMWSEAGSVAAPLGTDGLGRDLLARIGAGIGTSLGVAVAVTLIVTFIGVLVGMAAGYYGGIFDLLLMRLVDVQLALPTLLLAMVAMTVLDPSVYNVILVLALVGWTELSRIIRSRVLTLKQRDFVAAAQALGAQGRRVMLRHLIPNALPTIIVMVTLMIPRFILAEAALSFLGIGIPPSQPSLGGIVNEGRDYIWNAWWITTFPGLTIVVLIAGIGLIGDWLQEMLDPKLRT